MIYYLAGGCGRYFGVYPSDYAIESRSQSKLEEDSLGLEARIQNMLFVSLNHLPLLEPLRLVPFEEIHLLGFVLLPVCHELINQSVSYHLSETS